MMLALMAWPGAAGSPPIEPADTCTFCARIAATTSPVVRPIVVEPGRIDPDAHRVLRAEDLHVADALGAVERIQQVGGDVVGEILVAHAVVGGDEPQHDEEVARRLVHAHAGLLHFLRQQRHGELQLVLHLHLRDVRIGALREGQRDARGAVGTAPRQLM